MDHEQSQLLVFHKDVWHLTTYGKLAEGRSDGTIRTAFINNGVDQSGEVGSDTKPTFCAIPALRQGL